MDILHKFGFPLCQRTRIPVKTLVEQLCGEAKNRKLLESHVASISLVSLLNEQTIRIRAYKDDDYSFQVIYVLDIALKINGQMTEFTDLVHSAFPESTLLFLHYNNKSYISGAFKRINKHDHSKTVIEDSIWAELFEGFVFNSPDVMNLKEYYDYLLRLIYRIKAQNVTGLFPPNDTKIKDKILQYEALYSQIIRLREEYSAASMRNEKMRIDEKLFVKEQELEKLKTLIAGGG